MKHTSEKLGNVIPFRPLDRHIPRRRPPALIRWLKPFFAALLIVSLPVALIGWLLTTPRLTLDELRVEHAPVALSGIGSPLAAAPRVPTRWAQQQLAQYLGENLLSLSLEVIEGRLRDHPWIAGVDLRKELPHRLHVRIIERRAAALLNERQRLFYVDEQGSLIAPLHPLEPAPDLVVISRPDPEAAALRTAIELAQRITQLDLSWAADLSEIEILGHDDFCVFSGQLPFALLISEQGLEEKTRHLERLLPQIRERYPAAVVVDLRFSRRILIQPSLPDALQDRATWQVERS